MKTNYIRSFILLSFLNASLIGMQTPAASSSSASSADTETADEGAPINFFSPEQLQRILAAQELQEQLVNDRKEMSKRMDMHWKASQLTISNVTCGIPLSPRTKAVDETIYLLNHYKVLRAQQSHDASDILLKAQAAFMELTNLENGSKPKKQ